MNNYFRPTGDELPATSQVPTRPAAPTTTTSAVAHTAAPAVAPAATPTKTQVQPTPAVPQTPPPQSSVAPQQPAPKQPEVSAQPATPAPEETDANVEFISSDPQVAEKQKKVAEERRAAESHTVELDEIVAENEAIRQANRAKRRDVNEEADQDAQFKKNIDNFALLARLSTRQETSEAYTDLVNNTSREENDRAMMDVTSRQYQLSRVTTDLSSDDENELAALRRLGDKPEDAKKLDYSYKGIADDVAVVDKYFAQSDTYEATKNANMIFNALLNGGMRRINLWNSGFTLTLRCPTLSELNDYYTAINRMDLERGAQHGALYYHFGVCAITREFVDHLLPVVIRGSSYNKYTNHTALLKAISLQDFNTIVWALSVLMNPDGAYVDYVCAHEGCNHTQRELVDLSKLRLLNTDIINDDMVNYFKDGNRVVDDEKLDLYHKLCKFDRTLEFVQQKGATTRTWKIEVKQASLYDYLVEADRFLVDLDMSARLDDDEADLDKETVEYLQRQAVENFFRFNGVRAFIPWIRKITLTDQVADGKTRTVIYDLENSENKDNIPAVMEKILNALSIGVPDFVKKMDEYITGTRVSHIAYYYPECPRCHTPPSNSWNGYVPYDALFNFFMLATIYLLRPNVT